MKERKSKRLGLAGKVLIAGLLALSVGTCIFNY